MTTTPDLWLTPLPFLDNNIALHQDVGATRTDLIYDVINNTVVNPHTVAVTGIDWHVA